MGVRWKFKRAKIRAIMTEKGLTADDVADYFAAHNIPMPGAHESYIVKLLWIGKPRPNMKEVNALSSILGVDRLEIAERMEA